MTSVRETECPYTTWDDMVLPIDHSWSDMEDDDIPQEYTGTSKRIWFGKEAQEIERPYTSWDDIILPTEYSWSDLEKESSNNESELEYKFELEDETEEAKLECRLEELNERPAPEYDTDDDWSSDDESDYDSHREHEDWRDEFYDTCHEHFDDWPSYHQD
ncbi:hypothetical protein FPOAC2_05302 [Fusarium poae]|jgi:hypothetical protein|uniref:Uncharacterized protein n=1 Tax=Fusarium poae TaxID=36050 RepID=A0A1B8AUE7_FUSPO|nr:hypothetical protein FPOAC1_005198 [Fusarium poae]KAG8671940.1 hypothetical protein FPOAC1_005198 [Fusarium poae]OBS24159.1 hypothetical protein FPOA_04706 [Fusarium poae]